MHHIARRTAGITAAIAAVGLVVVGCSDDNKTPSVGDVTNSAKAAAGSATDAAGSAMESAKGAAGSATESAANGGENGASGAGGETKIATPNGDVTVAGPILAKYTEAGGEKGTLGAPTAAQEASKDGGSYQDFTGGTIYFNDKTQAHIVWGEIRKAWEGDGGPNGALGFPTSDEHPIANGLQSDFEHGDITYIDGKTEIHQK